MFSKPVAVGLLALACVTAAAGGAYVAVRSSSAVAPTAAPSAQATPTTALAVKETEAVVSPAASGATEPLEKANPAPAAAAPAPATVGTPSPAPTQPKAAPAATTE